jgi:hypothetical protein
MYLSEKIRVASGTGMRLKIPLLNRIALNPVRNEQSHKRSIKAKRLDAG